MIDTAAHGLEGLNAVVTGAAQGLGLAIAEELGRRGARVTMADVQAQKVREAAAGLGKKGLRVEAAALDISDSRAVREFFEAFVGSRGRESTSWSTTPAHGNRSPRWPSWATGSGTGCWG